MNERAREFVDNWVAENINPTGYEAEGDRTESEQQAMACWEAADKAGISRKEIGDAVGDLVDYMANAIEEANDAEVRRQIAKDRS